MAKVSLHVFDFFSYIEAFRRAIFNLSFYMHGEINNNSTYYSSDRTPLPSSSNILKASSRVLSGSVPVECRFALF